MTFARPRASASAVTLHRGASFVASLVTAIAFCACTSEVQTGFKPDSAARNDAVTAPGAEAGAATVPDGSLPAASDGSSPSADGAPGIGPEAGTAPVDGGSAPGDGATFIPDGAAAECPSGVPVVATTLLAPDMQVSQPQNGQFEGDTYVTWGPNYLEAPACFPVAGTYTFTINAYVSGVAAVSELRIDQITRQVIRVNETAVAPHTLRVFISPGVHRIAVSRADDYSEMHLQNVAIALDAAQPAQTVFGNRDPFLQPFSSSSLWNTAIGADAVWSAPADADTIDVRSPGGTINCGCWSMPFYLATASDPLGTLHTTDDIYPQVDLTLRIPVAATPDPCGDAHLVLFSPDKRWMYNNFQCTRNGTGFSCDLDQTDDVCGEGLGDYGWGAGVIRKWEIEGLSIKHMLRYALPTNLTKAGDTWVSGLAWPANRSDAGGPYGGYTGHVLYGSTVGIPAAVDIAALGLTPAGLMLARALQDYGAIQRDTGGDGGILFYAEDAAQNLPAIADMLHDYPTIVPHLAILRNQGPNTPNGGGARRQPAVEPISSAICPYY
jgi:hypothetical protein